MVVDDSALYRQLIRNVLREVHGVDVVGAAKSGAEALSMIADLDPDLLTLDVRMPDIDGIEVLRTLKRNKSKVKAIMLSSVTANGAQVTTDALFEGAFDFIHKPSGSDANANRQQLLEQLTEKIATFRVSPANRSSRRSGVINVKPAEPAAKSTDDSEAFRSELILTRYEAVVIGTSTGGPVALREVLPEIPGDFPVPIFIVQHMPALYTHSLAERLNETSQIEVVEGVDGMSVEPGFAYLSPGGRHMKIERLGGRMVIRVTDDPPENSCRPAVDYLFRSAAEVFDGKVLAVILTGMGRDGTEGCREIKRRGGYILTQHSDGCVVYGMPKAVVEEKLSDRSVMLDRVASTIVRRVKRSREQ